VATALSAWIESGRNRIYPGASRRIAFQSWLFREDAQLSTQGKGGHK
jgi:hypothetical protein